MSQYSQQLEAELKAGRNYDGPPRPTRPRGEGLWRLQGAQGRLPDGNRGEKIVICGPSGSGKSTLMRCINRLEMADEGRIVVGGITLDHDVRNIRAVRRKTAMVFQSFNLFPHMTALDNLAFAPVSVLGPLPRRGRERGRRYLARVRILEHAQTYPGSSLAGSSSGWRSHARSRWSLTSSSSMSRLPRSTRR